MHFIITSEMALNEGKIVKACEVMKSLYGMPEPKVRAALSRLLRIYRDEWGFIEENNYEILFQNCMIEDEPKKQEEEKKSELKIAQVLLDDNSDQLLKGHLTDHSDEPSTSINTSKRSVIWSSEDEESVIEEKEPVQLSNYKRARASGSDTTTRNIIKGKKPEIEETACGRALAIDNTNVLYLYDNSSCEFSKETLPPAVNHPVASVSSSTPLELVSSDNGEAKLSLIYNSVLNNYTHFPSLDVFLKVVEDKICKKYGITDPRFCMKKLMRELCEYFLVAGNNVTNNELHSLSILDTSHKIEAEVQTNGKDYHQSNSNNQPSSLNVDDCNSKFVNPPFNVTKNPIFVEDITRGEEKQPISLANESGTLELPKFFYISKNTVYKNAYVNFSLARVGDENCCLNCSGDCLSAPANCACTSETRGNFAYTAAGLLDENFLRESIAIIRRKNDKKHLYYCENCPLENRLVNSNTNHKRKRSIKPCKGHLMRKFIKECWAKCGCSLNCGNRVVQRGITVKLQVFQTSEGKGWGVRTLEALEKGTFVCEYVGEVVTNQELYERNEEFSGDRHTYPVLLDADWASERHLKDEEALCLDATKFGNVARFINHRCYDANLIEIPVEIETPDHHFYHVAFFTTRKVEVNEELNWDYGIDFSDETHPIKAFDCKCGSFFCSV